MGVESIIVRSPQPDIQKMLDKATAELKADITKVQVVVDEIKVDVKGIKETT